MIRTFVEKDQSVNHVWNFDVLVLITQLRFVPAISHLYLNRLHEVILKNHCFIAGHLKNCVMKISPPLTIRSSISKVRTVSSSHRLTTFCFRLARSLLATGNIAGFRAGSNNRIGRRTKKTKDLVHVQSIHKHIAEDYTVGMLHNIPQTVCNNI